MATFGILFLQFFMTITSLKIISKLRRVNLLDISIILFLCLILTIIPSTFGPILLMIFTYFMSYYYQKEIISTVFYGSFSLLVVLVSDHIAFYIDIIVFRYIPQMTDTKILFHLFIYVVLGISLSTVVLKLFQFIVNQQLKLFMTFIGFSTVFIYYTLFYGMVSIGDSVDLIKVSLFFFLAYLALSIFSFTLYAVHLKKQYQIKIKEEEYEGLKKYMSEIEKQYTNMRKFRHDYQNILISLEFFILEEDIQGLSKYYENVLQPTSKFIHENNFKLQNLGQIKIKELKSIFASKLMLAQELGINAKFETNADILKIPIDSYTLITTVGILLDNAIEELEYIGHGDLLTGIIKDDNIISIIIQNSCRSEVPQLHLLKQPGFSTKGTDRGLGLSNFHEMLSPLNHVTTETVIRDNLFIQIIYIQLED